MAFSLSHKRQNVLSRLENRNLGKTDVSRAAKAAPGRDEGAQTFGVG